MQSCSPLVPEIDFKKSSLLLKLFPSLSIPAGHRSHLERKRVPESSRSSILTFVMA
jgi:hypothetical protein